MRRYFVDVEDLEVNTSSDYSKRNQKDHKDPDSHIKGATKAAETSERKAINKLSIFSLQFNLAQGFNIKP